MPTYTFRCKGTCEFYTSIEAPTPVEAMTRMLLDECSWQVDRDAGETRLPRELSEYIEVYDHDTEGVGSECLLSGDYEEEAALEAMRRSVAVMKEATARKEFNISPPRVADPGFSGMTPGFNSPEFQNAALDLARTAYVELEGRDPAKPFLEIEVDPSMARGTFRIEQDPTPHQSSFDIKAALTAAKLDGIRVDRSFVSELREHRHDIAGPITQASTNREGLTYTEWLRAAGIEAGEKLVPLHGPYSVVATMRAWQDGEDPTEWRNDDRVKL